MEERNSCRIHTGRLMEIRVWAGYRVVQDVDHMIAMMDAEFARVPEPTQVVIAADWRRCRVLTPDVAERANAMLTRSNPRVERSTILHDADHAIGMLQALRLAREANFPNRRVFTNSGELRDWLQPILTDQELQRLDLLLAERV